MTAVCSCVHVLGVERAARVAQVAIKFLERGERINEVYVAREIFNTPSSCTHT